MASFYFKVILCRIRIFPRLISKIKWLGSGLPLIWGKYFKTNQKDLSEKSSISSNSSDDETEEKKMKEISKSEEAEINQNNGEKNEAFEEESAF